MKTPVLVFVIFALATFDVSAQVRVRAFSGVPFGVAEISVPVRDSSEFSPVDHNGVIVEGSPDRLFYPAVSTHKILAAIREVTGIGDGGSPRITTWFLFRGNTPFEVSLKTPEEHRVVVYPQNRPRRHPRMMRLWWRNYAAVTRNQVRQGDYPPVVEYYMACMLSNRFGVDASRAFVKLDESPEAELLNLTLNLEPLRNITMKRKMLKTIRDSSVTHQLPPELPWPNVLPDPELKDVEVEPIAHRVPAECFYLRFGSFSNYLWFKDLIEKNGGDLARMISLRGHDAKLSEKSQTQLGMKESLLSKILGSQVISDIAIIGRDTYLQEGAAIGVIFEAKNQFLKTSLVGQRAKAVKEIAGAKIRDIQIGDHTVSFADSPGNRLRSFYVVDGKYHLVSNCRQIVERFIETGKNIGSLADTNDFRQARADYPISDDDAVFGHLSRDFFKGLLSWQYQVELQRRLASTVEMQIAELSQLASTAEHLGHAVSVADQIREGFLPVDFNRRTDGSKIRSTDSGWVDSLRGNRGTFLPIPDVPIRSVTSSELDYLAKVTKWQANRWTNLDPMTVSVVREESEDDETDLLKVSLQLFPFDKTKYGKILSVVGPPTEVEITTLPNQIASLQMSVRGGQLRPSAGPHNFFWGLRDTEMPTDFMRGRLLRTLKILRTAPAYFGAWPKPGLLDLFVGQRFFGDYGMSRLPFGLWRWQSDDGFSVVSFDRNTLDLLVPHLGIQPTDDDAQIRFQIGDISQSKIKNWFEALSRQRALETSVGNTRLFHQLRQQLRVPVSESKVIAERIVNAELVCPLGGEYLLSKDQPNDYWISTGWESIGNSPENYKSPLLKWFRGVVGKVILRDDRASSDVEIRVARQGILPANPFFKSPDTPEPSEPPSGGSE